MCVNKPRGAQHGTCQHQPTDHAVERIMALLSDLPASERSGAALGIASRLIEYAAFEMAGQHSADDVGDLINCAARVNYASADVRMTPSGCTARGTRRMQ